MTSHLRTAVDQLDEVIASTVQAVNEQEAPREVLGVCLGSLYDLRAIYTHHEESRST